MTHSVVSWIAVDSKSSLMPQLAEVKNHAELVTSDANSWGFFRPSPGCALSVGYANNGLIPSAVITGELFLVGTNELLSAYDAFTLSQVFCYRMPSIFHEFVSVGEVLVVRDEVGFVGLSTTGVELWCHLTEGPIENFEFTDSCIKGVTIDGEQFLFNLS